MPVRSHMQIARRSVTATGKTALADMPADSNREGPCSVASMDGDPTVDTVAPPMSTSGSDLMGKAMKFVGMLMMI